MYVVYLDGELLHYPADDKLILIDPVVNLALDDAGQFQFTIAPNHPMYDKIYNRISMVQVLKDDKEIFYGEVREQESNFYKEKQVYCVGELAFLYDSIQPQAEFHDIEPRVFLDTLIQEHNSQVEVKKRFETGIVTVHDTNDSLYRFTNYEDTLTDIRDKICDRLNGHIRVRKADGKRYIDIVPLSEYGKICKQSIEFGENLLDYSEKISGTEIYTTCIPLGATIQKDAGAVDSESTDVNLEKRVDITSVNDGKNYVFIQDAVDKYGWIKAVVKFDNINIPSNLKTKGEKWLRDNQYENMVLTLNALDLSLLDTELDTFEVGDSVHAFAAPYGMDRYFPVQKLDVYLTTPDKNTLTLGANVSKSVSDLIVDSEKTINSEIEKNNERTQWLQSAIDNATQMLTGTKGGYRLDEYDENGLFLRTLYMDAPNKDDAVNILQIGPQGIGFSNNGFDGPYESAWTLDGTFVGKFIKAHSIKGEALETEYIEHVEQLIEDAETGAKEYADSTITTQIKAMESQITLAVKTEMERASGVEEQLSSQITITQESIESEVIRATSEEESIRSLIEQTENSIKLEVQTVRNAVTEKNGIYYGSGTPTMSNEPAKNWNTAALKESHIGDMYYDTANGYAYRFSGQLPGVLITFSSDSRTESVSYDYVEIYYEKSGITYCAGKFGGTAVAGATVFVPSSTFWVYWRTDSSQDSYYGFRIASVVKSTGDITGAQKSLPDYPVTEMATGTYPESVHGNYGNGRNQIWKCNTGISVSTTPTMQWVRVKDADIDAAEAAAEAASDKADTAISRIIVAESSITSEVSRAKNAESSLGSRIDQTEREISLCVTDDELTGNKIISKINLTSTTATIASSKVNIDADSIRLKASSIAWSSTNSSMTSSGILTCKKAVIEGTLKTSSVRVLDDSIEMYDGSTLVGRFIFEKNVSLTNNTTSDGTGNLLSIRAANYLGIRASRIYMQSGSTRYRAYTGTVEVWDGKTPVNTLKKFRYINGILVSV